MKYTLPIALSPHTSAPVSSVALALISPPVPLPISAASTPMTVHPTAVSGFGSDTANYDSARPDHQPPAVSHLLQNLHIPPGGTLVEIGSGTGKFTSHLLNRPEAWKIICVEPSDDMRKTHQRIHPGVEIREGNAYEVPVEDGSVDAVICAQVTTVSWKRDFLCGVVL